ncbi:hypothetical protein BDF21DRAFT_397824 [Thamnidium elegans]|nr:hypothetical protein BDF21DRAFT_397824 [Thamnidium elegans]
MQAINDSHYEYPCLYFTVDLADPLWVNYFSAKKMKYRNVSIYMITTLLKTAGDYYEFISNQKLKLSDAYDKRWPGYFEEDEILNTSDFSEGDLLHNLWPFVYKAFSLLDHNLELSIMNVPAGRTTTRISRIKKLPFPNGAINMKLDSLPLLEVTLIGKMLMENLAQIIDN